MALISAPRPATSRVSAGADVSPPAPDEVERQQFPPPQPEARGRTPVRRVVAGVLRFWPALLLGLALLGI